MIAKPRIKRINKRIKAPEMRYATQELFIKNSLGKLQ
jgi:hypothetical protein